MTADPSTLDHRLAAIGDALEQAVTAELRRAASRPASAPSAAAAAPRRRWRPRRRAALLSVAALIVVPSVALAANDLLWSDSQVAASLPQGTLALGGTDPTCTTVVANVEYHCTLAKAPSTQGAAAPASAGAGALSQPKRQALVKHGFHVVRVQSGFAIVTRAGRTYYVVVPTAGAGSGSGSGSANWRGTVEPSVDSTKHVNGGCRALNAAGTEWECYIGEAAVTQSIISQGFLGQYAPSPGVG